MPIPGSMRGALAAEVARLVDAWPIALATANGDDARVEAVARAGAVIAAAGMASAPKNFLSGAITLLTCTAN